MIRSDRGRRGRHGVGELGRCPVLVLSGVRRLGQRLVVVLLGVLHDENRCRGWREGQRGRGGRGRGRGRGEGQVASRIERRERGAEGRPEAGE